MVLVVLRREGRTITAQEDPGHPGRPCNARGAALYLLVRGLWVDVDLFNQQIPIRAAMIR